jgi:uncharacterized protein (TIGR01244 family)
MTPSRLALPTAVLLLAAALPAGAKETLASPFVPPAGQATAPFGDAVGPAIPTYSRVAPLVATAAAPGPAGLDRAKAMGFARVIDLRGANESGVTEDAAHARAIGLDRVVLVMPMKAEAMPDFTRALTALVDAPESWPLLIVCGSANRASAAWALYRAGQGVPPLIAIEEARAAGLTRAEPLVRQALGLPPPPPAPVQTSAPATR